MAPTAQIGDVEINNPDMSLTSRKAVAADIHYFFERSGDKVICKECKQVLCPYLNRFPDLPQCCTGKREQRIRPNGHQTSNMSIQGRHRLHLFALISKSVISIYTCPWQRREDGGFCCQDLCHKLDRRRLARRPHHKVNGLTSSMNVRSTSIY